MATKLILLGRDVEYMIQYKKSRKLDWQQIKIFRDIEKLHLFLSKQNKSIPYQYFGGFRLEKIRELERSGSLHKLTSFEGLSYVSIGHCDVTILNRNK